MALEDPTDKDEIISSGDFKFIVGEDLNQIYERFAVDYTDNWLRRGFSITSNRNMGGC